MASFGWSSLASLSWPLLVFFGWARFASVLWSHLGGLGWPPSYSLSWPRLACVLLPRLPGLGWPLCEAKCHGPTLTQRNFCPCGAMIPLNHGQPFSFSSLQLTFKASLAFRPFSASSLAPLSSPTRATHPLSITFCNYLIASLCQGPSLKHSPNR